MHIEDEQIQRALHGELPAPAREELERHLARCAACRTRLEEAEREEEWVFDLLRHGDQAVPEVDAGFIAHRARAANAVAWGRWAAGFVLAIAAAGAAYSAPGSPLPAWVNQVVTWVAGLVPEAASPQPPGPAPPASAGIAVAPSDRFQIHFAAPQSGGTAVVTVTDGPNVIARVHDGTTTFTTDVDRLTIENRGSTADYEIELPRSTPWVEITVGERRLLIKQGDRLVTHARTDARGRTLLPLAPEGP